MIHFISGLPRSGSTLLAAILRQNPRFHAAISTPLVDLVRSLVNLLSGHEGALFISAGQRESMLRSFVESYYAEQRGTKVIFDTGRGWCALLPAVSQLFPDARVICCVRNPAWILDSVERSVQRNPLVAPKMFGNELTNVYNRVEGMSNLHFLGPAMKGLRQAWYGEQADRLIGIRYEALVDEPLRVISSLYDLLGLERFDHNFEHVEYEAPEFDAQIGMPGFHRVCGKVAAKPRQTILPPELFGQYDHCFWDEPDQNPRGVKIL